MTSASISGNASATLTWQGVIINLSASGVDELKVELAKFGVRAPGQEEPAPKTAKSKVEIPTPASSDKLTVTVTYADLQAAVLKLHKLDATAAKPIAEGMGYANFKAMPEDKWPEALSNVRAALSERGVV